MIAIALAVGCTTSTTSTTNSTEPGSSQAIAEVRVAPSPTLSVPITRVTVDAAGASQDLLFDPGTGTYDGTLFLPSGTQSLVASAFSGDTLVAQSRATSIDVETAAVTRVMIRLLDVTVQGPPQFGPIIDSMSFPTATNAGTPATLSVTAVAPTGDPLSYAWTSDCSDSTFSAPDAATTSWTKVAQGTCTISVTVSSDGFSVGQSVPIVVFPAGTGTGAAAVSGTIVIDPGSFLSLTQAGCTVFPDGNSSCPTALASPSTTSYQLSVFSWGGSSPGTLDVSDNCGGSFGSSQRTSDEIDGFWLPPVGGGVCLLTGRAVSADGLVTTVTAAVLTHAGTVPAVQPPVIGVSFDDVCFLVTPGARDCGQFPPGATHSLFGTVGWVDGHPGSLTISDDCVGPQPDPASTSVFNASWTAPTTPGTCHVTVRATSLEGSRTDAVLQYRVAAPPTPPAPTAPRRE